MSSAEFTDWVAYGFIEPYGHPIEQWRWASLTAHVVNAVRSTIPLAPGKKLKAFKPDDFYPSTDSKSDGLTDEQRAYLERKRKKKRG